MAIAAFERWGLNPREQRMATLAVYVLAVALVLAIPVGLSSMVASRRAENDELREALASVNGARAKIRDRQERRASITTRYAKKVPELGGFLEQNANAANVQIAEKQDRDPVNHGKQYVERHTIIRLKNGGMAPIVGFLESIEKSEYPVAVTRLNIRKRAGEPDSYGPVEIGVSAFDRNTPASTPAPADSEGAAKGTK
jgi:general secretion pathway protein M